jgi:beta-lactamase class A
MGIRTTLACSAALALAMAAGVTVTATATAATGTAGTAGTASGPTVQVGICTAPVKFKALAARLSHDIQAALAGRGDEYAVTVFDRTRWVTCRLNEGHRFHSASVVKATILAALLRWHQETGRPLTSNEKYLATLMITQSDNNAASALWDELGHARIQHFLNLARMTETILGSGGYWGLTEITARDELTLLRLLTKSNAVLSDYSRNYELGLMSKVVSWQRWGTPAGAPSGITVHVKNGWLPESVGGWHINSIGAFNGHGRDYMMAVLTDDNPSMAYGVTTIERVAEVVHRDINAGLPPAGAPFEPSFAPAQLPPDSVGAPSPAAR